MGTVTLISGAAFDRKVELALSWWKRNCPDDVMTFLAEVKKRREASFNAAASTADKSVVNRCLVPEIPVKLLRMTEFETNMRFGIPCGTGDVLWDSDAALQEQFLRHIPEANISNQRGAPASRRESRG